MDLIEDILKNLPQVITIQQSLRENGPVEKSMIIRVSSTLGDFCNDIKNICYNFNLDLLEEARYALEDADNQDKIDFYQTIEEKNRYFRKNKLNKNMKSAEIEALLPFFPNRIVIGHIFSDKFNYSSDIIPFEYTEAVFKFAKALRLLSNRKRHQDQQDFTQTDEEIAFWFSSCFSSKRDVICFTSLSSIFFLNCIFFDKSVIGLSESFKTKEHTTFFSVLINSSCLIIIFGYL